MTFFIEWTASYIAPMDEKQQAGGKTINMSAGNGAFPVNQAMFSDLKAVGRNYCSEVEIVKIY